MSTSTTANSIPQVHIEAGTGVHPSSIDYALDQLRSLSAPYPVAALRARITRTDHPAMPTAVLTDVSADVRGQTIKATAVGRTPRLSIDNVCQRLATRLHRWDPCFKQYMTLADVYRFPTQHFDFHRRQLTLAGHLDTD